MPPKILGTQMRQLLLVVLLVFSGKSFALPPCPSGVFHNCYDTFTYPDGAKYVGEFGSDKRHGQGVYTFADGREVVGEFKLGKSWNAVAYDASGKLVFSFKNGVAQ